MNTQAHARRNAVISTRRTARKVPFLGVILRLHAIWAERRRLARLDAHRLDDLGLTRDEAQKESRRSTWDAPERWTR